MRRFALFLLLVVAGTAHGADITVPPLTGRVVDQAGILSASAEQSLTAELRTHEAATGQQVVVATLASLEERDIAEYGVALGRAWGIGQKDKNTGVILLVAPNERAVRIEVGYGLEGTLTDATSRLIIENVILPQFRAGNMEAGIIAGIDAMLPVLRGDPEAAPAPLSEDPGEIPPILAALAIVLLMYFISGGRPDKPSKLDYWHATHGRRRGGGGFLGGGSGGGRAGGGFFGGGGSFGGGGASGRW